MRLIIVRHGESEANVAGLAQGSSSVVSNLTARGREQAAMLADKLRDIKIDLAFISPLDRTKQTAEIILADHPDTKIEFTDQLREKDTGEFAGRPSAEMYNAWKESGQEFGEFQPVGGESWYQAGERIVGFIEGVIKRYKDSDSNILIVGHGSVFTYLLMWADKFDPKKDTTKETYDYYHPDNTAVAMIETDPVGQPILVSLNDTSHLV